MINRGNRIVILFHLYCCSKKIVYHAYSECYEPYSFCHINILIQNIIQAFCVFYLYTLDSITMIMGYSKHQRSTKNNMLYSQKHPYLPTTATSPHPSLSSVPKVAVMERFDCISVFFLPIFCSLRCFLAIMVTPHGQVLPVIVSFT